MQHNILQGIQGGSLNEYYHFNHSDYDSLQNLITYAVVSNTEYFNPSFIASLAGSKITGTLADNLVATASIQANAVDATKIADNAIITRHILNSNVTTDKIADNGITTAKIAYNAVTQDQIAYNAVGTNQIATNAISSNAVVNASGVAGSYVTDALNNLNGSFTNLVTKTTTYAASTTDYIIVGDTTSVGPFTITLPTAVGMSGKSYIIKRMGTGTLSIATTSSQTIDGDAAPYDITMDRTSVTIVSNGSNWILV
jgi:hypothetical protein